MRGERFGQPWMAGRIRNDTSRSLARKPGKSLLVVGGVCIRLAACYHAATLVCMRTRFIQLVVRLVRIGY